MKQQIDELLRYDIIRLPHSPYCSPVTYKKEEGKIRLCEDYRKINDLCKTDRELIPRIDSILDQLN